MDGLVLSKLRRQLGVSLTDLAQQCDAPPVLIQQFEAREIDVPAVTSEMLTLGVVEIWGCRISEGCRSEAN